MPIKRMVLDGKDINELHREGKLADVPIVPIGESTTESSTFSIEPIGDVFDREPPDRVALLKDTEGRLFVPKGKVGLLAAAGGVGKTFAVTSLAVSIATGKPWFGYQVPKPGKVFLMIGEELEEEIRRRLYWTAKSVLSPDEKREYSLAGNNIYALSTYGVQNTRLANERGNLTPFANELERKLSAVAFDAIIIDPASRFMPIGAETDNALATVFITALERLAALPGEPTVLFAHHTRKSERDGGAVGATAVRGSSALVDGARFVLTLCSLTGDKVPVQKVCLSCEKSNYGPCGEPVTLLRKEHGVLELLSGPKANRDVGES